MGGGILGVGPMELFVIFILALVVAGPKRMVGWAYHAGRYMSVLRGMFQETMDAFQKELNAAGMDPETTKTLSELKSSRFNVLNEVSKVINTEPTSVSATTPIVQTPELPATPPPASDSKSDDDQPRYDSWLPS
jgi:Sec-independent protein translocase protein TatA